MIHRRGFGLWRRNEEQLEHHLSRLQEAGIAPNYASKFAFLYDCLGILDSKASALLAFNGIVLAALTVWLEGSAKGWEHVALDSAFLLLLGSSLLCLRVNWIRWESPLDLVAPERHAAKLLRVRDARTLWYRAAWVAAVTAICVVAVVSAFHFVDKLERAGATTVDRQQPIASSVTPQPPLQSWADLFDFGAMAVLLGYAGFAFAVVQIANGARARFEDHVKALRASTDNSSLGAAMALTDHHNSVAWFCRISRSLLVWDVLFSALLLALHFHSDASMTVQIWKLIFWSTAYAGTLIYAMWVFGSGGVREEAKMIKSFRWAPATDAAGPWRLSSKHPLRELFRLWKFEVVHEHLRGIKPKPSAGDSD